MNDVTSAPGRTLGALLTMQQQDADPYPALARLQAEEPVCWVEAFGMWYVTRYDDVISVLRDTRHFVAGTDQSLLQDTFGVHMLTTDGAVQKRYKDAFRGAFAPAATRQAMHDRVAAMAEALIGGFGNGTTTELRSSFASRLPVQSILSLFGLPLEEEPKLRHWYDDFEAALANFGWDDGIRQRARSSLSGFHDLIQSHIDQVRRVGGTGLLAQAMSAADGEPLSDGEIRSNAGIIFFGGISTVEALVLNSLYALLVHPDAMARVRSDRSLLPVVLEETMRWLTPVQSATRHVVEAVEFRGCRFEAGDTVNCMLGAANRDPARFANPDRFDLDRGNSRQHLGFATGDHFCLGSHFAKLQASIALGLLLDRFPNLRFREGQVPAVAGYEFRQPRDFWLELR